MHVPPSAVEAHHPWPSIFIVCDIRPEGSIHTISATMIILQHVSISKSVYCLQFLQNHIFLVEIIRSFSRSVQGTS